MTREFDRKEKERIEYLQDHLSIRSYKEENTTLLAKVVALKAQVKKLRDELKKLKTE
jgi:cell division protein FtsB